MRRVGWATIAIVGGLTALAVQAQTLQLSEPAAARPTVEAPSRGMTMAQVEARYGAPAERYPAVGQPPITRWVYAAFVVYFEYSHVVHAVTVTPPAPAP